MVGTDAGARATNTVSCTMLGANAGYYNQASTNTFLGSGSGLFNTYGGNNTFTGAFSGNNNQTGSQNTFVGSSAGQTNTSGNGNCYLGSRAGLDNSGGSNNTSIGTFAGEKNTKSDNTLVGFQAGNLVDAANNTMIGSNSGPTSTGGNNVFVGAASGTNNTTGSGNIALGYLTSFSANNYQNATVIGYKATCDASNKVRIGNPLVNVIEGQVMFSAASDRRLKTQIKDSSLGLSFVKALRPVQYQWKEGHGNKLFTGFIAQEVEMAAAAENYDFSAIVKPEDLDEGFYSLRYAEFVVPLVNAVKELNEKVESMQKEIIALKSKLGTPDSLHSSRED